MIKYARATRLDYNPGSKVFEETEIMINPGAVDICEPGGMLIDKAGKEHKTCLLTIGSRQLHLKESSELFLVMNHD